MELGYALSSEEHSPSELIELACRAEETGFQFAMLSDHYHPWVSQQGNSSFAWTVLGGIAQNTKTIRVGTSVTCPTFRYHPAIIAQAAATVAMLMPGRFILGLGTGEALNEHILGDHWPPATIRQDMLEEAVEIIHLLWSGEEQSHWGEYFIVENAQIFSLPEQLPPIYLAAVGTSSAELAGSVADGLISTAPKKEVIATFEQNGGTGKPKMGQVTVCWASDEETAKTTMKTWWPNSAIESALSADLPTPAHFEQAVKTVKDEAIFAHIPLGPDPQKHIQAIRAYLDAGFDQVYVHQIGPDQAGFFKFYQREVLEKV
jgi:G6PDH family F420-dependent oxidoreductase